LLTTLYVAMYVPGCMPALQDNKRKRLRSPKNWSQVWC